MTELPKLGDPLPPNSRFAELFGPNMKLRRVELTYQDDNGSLTLMKASISSDDYIKETEEEAEDDAEE